MRIENFDIISYDAYCLDKWSLYMLIQLLSSYLLVMKFRKTVKWWKNSKPAPCLACWQLLVEAEIFCDVVKEV